MDGYIVGIDGGGTKTAACVADLQGKALYEIKAGAININGEASDKVKKSLEQLLEEIHARSGGLEACRAVCIGAAGVSNGEARPFLEDIFRKSGYKGRLMITGDDSIALYGALKGAPGVIVIAGTGSVCYGRNSTGKEHRTGGYGYLIDDEGSGYAIGRDMLAAMVRAHDGRGEKTLLTQMVLEHFGRSGIEEVITRLYAQGANKRDIAALAPKLTAACALGDAAAGRIAEKCGDELIKLIGPVIERLELYDCTLAMSGSILQKDENIRSRLIARVASEYPGIKCKNPEMDASCGAVLMALEYLKNEAKDDKKFLQKY